MYCGRHNSALDGVGNMRKEKKIVKKLENTKIQLKSFLKSSKKANKLEINLYNIRLEGVHGQ